MDKGIRSIAFPSILITILNQCTNEWLEPVSDEEYRKLK